MPLTSREWHTVHAAIGAHNVEDAIIAFPLGNTPSPRMRLDSALFPRVVIGINFSPTSLSAGRWAIANIAPGADAVVAYVVTVAAAPGDTDLEPPRDSEFAHELSDVEHGLAGFGATLSLGRTRTAVPIGRPSRALRDLAAESDASLVIVGRRTDANRRRIGEANVIERLARTTTSSVLVVPEGITAPPRFLIAAVDESPYCAAILTTAAALARASGYGLVALHVVSPKSGTYDRVIDDGKRIRRHSAQHLELASASAPRLDPQKQAWLDHLILRERADIDARAEVVEGDPAREIVATAVSLGDALIVVGKRGADEAPAGSIGSVARRLLARSPLPVLAVEVGSGGSSS